MDIFIQQVMSGLATGGIYASLALALVMIYQATDVVNFAQGEMAMFATYLAWSMMNAGLPYWGAFLATLAVAFVGGVVIQRVLTDNGPAYRSAEWHHVCAEFGITVKKTRPYRPQTNGKVERFHRTLLTEWAYVRLYSSDAARTRALRKWQHIYNHHRGHTALRGLPPASRVTNLTGQYT